MGVDGERAVAGIRDMALVGSLELTKLLLLFLFLMLIRFEAIIFGVLKIFAP